MNTETRRGLPRWAEAVIASVALVLLAPLLGTIALLVQFTSPGPAIFRHRRAGRGGREFQMLKFRTMHSGASGPALTTKEDPRVTGVGRILRRTKLDELPQLWNVVRGEMSLVGPRPEAIEYVDLSDSLWRTVLSVRPGLTDPMTLRLRNEEELLGGCRDYEAFYLQHLLPYKLRGYCDYLAIRTWKRDVAVLYWTVAAVVAPSRVPAPSLDDVFPATSFAPPIFVTDVRVHYSNAAVGQETES